MAWWEPVPVSRVDPYVPQVEQSAKISVYEQETQKFGHIYIVQPTFEQGVITVVPVNNAAFDQATIMIELITQTYFQDNIKKFIPYEYWRMDAKTIADGGGEGSLEQFTEVFAITMDEIKQAIDEFVLLFDVEHCQPRYLRVIADMLGFPLEATDTTAEQRRQLRAAVDWYRSKGSRRAYEAILYAFGYYADIIPLWTEDYETFTETIPGVAKGNNPPNDYPLLVENGGTWYRSPHFGIRLRGIVNDRHVTLNWGGLTEDELPITDDIVALPDGIETAFYGKVQHAPLFASTLVGTAVVDTATVAITDDGVGGLSGTGVTGTIDYETGAWTLSFSSAPDNHTNIVFNYTYDFADLVEEVGYHRAFYRMVDELSKAGVVLQYHYSLEDFNYLIRRVEFMRPIFAVMDWLEHMVEMQEHYEVPEAPDPVMTVMPVRDEKGWYLGYCDLDDITYTRLDPRLIGDDLGIESPLTAGAPGVVVVNNEVTYTVSSTITSATGDLDNPWVFPNLITFTVVISAADYDVVDNGEGVLVGEDETVYGTIDYMTGDWELIFDGVNPDNPSVILVDYSYSTGIPPCDRSGAIPRGSTELPFPHVRDPQEGYCHPPEELDIDWYWLPEEPYQLPLTRDGMNLYPPAGPVPYIDHADFPSRGFTDAGSDPGHANTLTREFGYATRPLSLLRVEANPPAEAENWENQGEAWENWTGPWENIGD
jgi:phage tail-like protein